MFEKIKNQPIIKDCVDIKDKLKQLNEDVAAETSKTVGQAATKTLDKIKAVVKKIEDKLSGERAPDQDLNLTE